MELKLYLPHVFYKLILMTINYINPQTEYRYIQIGVYTYKIPYYYVN